MKPKFGSREEQFRKRLQHTRTLISTTDLHGSNPHLKGVVVYDRLLAGPRGAIDDEVFSTTFHLPVFILALPNVSLKFRRMKFTQFVAKTIGSVLQFKKKKTTQSSHFCHVCIFSPSL